MTYDHFIQPICEINVAGQMSQTGKCPPPESGLCSRGVDQAQMGQHCHQHDRAHLVTVFSLSPGSTWTTTLEPKPLLTS